MNIVKKRLVINKVDTLLENIKGNENTTIEIPPTRDIIFFVVVVSTSFCFSVKCKRILITITKINDFIIIAIHLSSIFKNVSTIGEDKTKKRDPPVNDVIHLSYDVNGRSINSLNLLK